VHIKKPLSLGYNKWQDKSWCRTLVAQPPAAVPAGMLAAAELAAAERRRLATPCAFRLATVAPGLDLVAAAYA